jgi:hypothetical protein
MRAGDRIMAHMGSRSPRSGRDDDQAGGVGTIEFDQLTHRPGRVSLLTADGEQNVSAYDAAKFTVGASPPARGEIRSSRRTLLRPMSRESTTLQPSFLGQWRRARHWQVGFHGIRGRKDRVRRPRGLDAWHGLGDLLRGDDLCDIWKFGVRMQRFDKELFGLAGKRVLLLVGAMLTAVGATVALPVEFVDWLVWLPWITLSRWSWWAPVVYKLPPL